VAEGSLIPTGRTAEYLTFATEFPRDAGRLALEHYRTGTAIQWRADGSPVTAADRGAERLIRDRLAAQYPTNSVVGEESGPDERRRAKSGHRWVVDPIDGTRTFVHVVPLSACSSPSRQTSRSSLVCVISPRSTRLLRRGMGSDVRGMATLRGSRPLAGSEMRPSCTRTGQGCQADLSQQSTSTLRFGTSMSAHRILWGVAAPKSNRGSDSSRRTRTKSRPSKCSTVNRTDGCSLSYFADEDQIPDVLLRALTLFAPRNVDVDHRFGHEGLAPISFTCNGNTRPISAMNAMGSSWPVRRATSVRPRLRAPRG
jgi:Inositol monophosphatase family